MRHVRPGSSSEGSVELDVEVVTVAVDVLVVLVDVEDDEPSQEVPVP
jgi:hypothetical protein